MNTKAKVAVFVSGGGSNLQSLINASKRSELSAEIVLVISNKSKAFGLERARNEGIDTFVYLEKRYPTAEDAEKDLLEMLDSYGVEYIALAGYLRLLPFSVVKKYEGKITNIHPALLPKYGGKGMYGHHVHEAVLGHGCKVTGVTVHLVDDEYDHGPIVAQRSVVVEEGDTPETLAARVLKVEHQIYAETLQLFAEDRIEVRGQKTVIR